MHADGLYYTLVMFVDAATYRAQARGLLRGFDVRSIDELVLNRYDSMWALGRGQVRRLSSPFATREQYEDWLLEFSLRRSIKLDAIDCARGGDWGRLRWHVVLPPLSPDGPLLSLRRHRMTGLEPEDFAGWAEHREAIVGAIRRPGLLLFAGATGSGKSTLMHAVLQKYCGRERLGLIETIQELPLTNAKWFRLVVKPHYPLLQLLAEALRLRPDRLVLGEIRKDEVPCLVQAAAIGHGAVVSTMHASDEQMAMARLQSMGAGADPCFAISDVTIVMMNRGNPPSIRSVGSAPAEERFHHFLKEAHR